MKLHRPVLVIAFCLPLTLLAQQRRVTKDSLSHLICPLNEAREAPKEKLPYELGVEQPKLALVSATDTTVKACMAGTVTTVMRDEEGKWQVMFNNKDYYFFYTGIAVVKVVRGQKIKAGETIGIIKPNARIELMIYDFETPLDPKRYVECFK